MNRILFPIAFLAAVIWVWRGRMGVSYRMTSDRFEVKLFGVVTLWSARYEDIVRVERYRPSLRDMAFGAVPLSNRPSFGRMVRIWRKEWFGKSAIITPDDPDAFISTLRARLQNTPTAT